MFTAARKFLVYPLICSFVLASETDADPSRGGPALTPGGWGASRSGGGTPDVGSPSAVRLVQTIELSQVARGGRGVASRPSRRAQRAQAGGVCGALYWFFTGCGMCSRPAAERASIAEDWHGASIRHGGGAVVVGENPIALRRMRATAAAAEARGADEEEGGDTPVVFTGGTPVAPAPLTAADEEALAEYLYDELHNRGPHHRDEGDAAYCGKSALSWIGSWGAAVVPHVMMMYAFYKNIPEFLGYQALPIELEGEHEQSWAPLLINLSIVGTHVMMMPGAKAQLHRLIYRTSKCCRVGCCFSRRRYQDDGRFQWTWSQCGRATAVTALQVGTGLANIVPDLRIWGGTVDTSNGLDAFGSASALPFFMAEFDEHMEDGAGLRSTVTYRDPVSRRQRERLIAHAHRAFTVLKNADPHRVEDLFDRHGAEARVLELLRETVPLDYEAPETRATVAREALMGRRAVADVFESGYDDPGTAAVVAASAVNAWASYGLFTSAQFAFNTGAQAIGVPAFVAEPASYVGATIVSGTRLLKGMRDLPLYFEHIGNTLMCRRHRRDPSSDWLWARMSGRAADIPFAFALGMRDVSIVLPTLARGDVGAALAVGLPVVTVRAGTEYARVLGPNREAIVTDLRPAPRSRYADPSCNTTRAIEVLRAKLMDSTRQLEALALRAPSGAVDLMVRRLDAPRIVTDSRGASALKFLSLEGGAAAAAEFLASAEAAAERKAREDDGSAGAPKVTAAHNDVA